MTGEKLSPLQLGGLVSVMLACFTVSVTVAYNIGAIVAGYNASAAEAGLVATAQGLGTAAAALVTARLITRFYSRQLFITGLTILAIGNGFSAFAPTIEMLAAFQCIGGVGTGVVVAVVMSAAARTSNPEMTYGYVNASFGGYIILLGFVMPQVILSTGIKGAFVVYAAVAALGLVGAFLAPNSKAAAGGHGAGGDQPASAAAIPARGNAYTVGMVALIGFGVFFFAQSGLGAFVERIGRAAEVPLVSIGQVFAIGGLLTIAGPLVAGWIGSRFGSSLPLILVGIGLSIVTFFLTVLNTQLSFYVAAPLFTVLPAILMPSFLGSLAVIDPTGRIAAMQPAFATLGGALGPVFSGIIVVQAGFLGLGWYTIAIFGIGMTLMAAATVSADRTRRQLQPALSVVRTFGAKYGAD